MAQALSAQLNAVRALRPAPLDAAEAARVQLGLWKAAGKQSRDRLCRHEKPDASMKSPQTEDDETSLQIPS